MLPDVVIGMWSGEKLPYDAEVEWIKGDGKSFIDTGMNADSNLSMSVKYGDAYASSTETICGAIGDVGGIRFRHFLQINTNNSLEWYFYTNTPNVKVFNIQLTDSVITADASSNELVFNNVPYAGKGYSVFNIGATAYLLAWHDKRSGGDSAGNISKYKIYNAKFWNSSKTVDLIPVRFTNEGGETEGAMYDNVSGKLFRNAGTGAFVIGPDK